MSNLADIKALKKSLKRLGIFAQKKLGQNFLVDTNVLQKICDAAELQPHETVLEIGPGPGALTQKLLASRINLIAIEKDPQMLTLLKHNLGSPANLQTLHQNALHYEPTVKAYKIVANLPYYLTSPLLRHYLLEVKDKPSLVILLLQDEVARKITDPKKLSLLSLQVKIFGNPQYLFRVPAKAFYPAPKVNSAVIAVHAFESPLVAPIELNSFFQTVKIGFSQKRKKLLNSFLSGTPWSKTQLSHIFSQADIDPARRPQTLSITEWKTLSRIFAQQKTSQKEEK